MNATAITGADADTQQFLTFKLAGEEYGVGILSVQEIRGWSAVTAIPHSPAWLLGVINLRGAVVPVVDLGRVLGGAAVAATPTARIAIVEESGLVMGLAVDAALEVLSVDATALEDPPALATQAGYDAARAVVRRPDAGPVLVLSLEHILESVYRSAPARQQEDAA